MKAQPPLTPEAVQRQIRAARLHGVLAAIDQDGSEGPATAALRSVALLYVEDPRFRQDGTDLESPRATDRSRHWMRRYLRRAYRYRTYRQEGLI